MLAPLTPAVAGIAPTHRLIAMIIIRVRLTDVQAGNAHTMLRTVMMLMIVLRMDVIRHQDALTQQLIATTIMTAPLTGAIQVQDALTLPLQVAPTSAQVFSAMTAMPAPPMPAQMVSVQTPLSLALIMTDALRMLAMM